MSTEESTSTPKPPVPKWGDPISKERQAELRAILDAWNAETEHGKRHGPFAGVRLTGADVGWLAEQSRREEYGGIPHLHLEQADLRDAHLEQADLREAHLEEAHLREAHLEKASLTWAHLERADLGYVHLEGADLALAHLEEATLDAAHLEGTLLLGAHLKRAYLDAAHLEGAFLAWARLENAYLSRAHLEGAILDAAHLEGADLRAATLDGKTILIDAILAESPTLLDRLLNWLPLTRRNTSASFGDVRWGGVGTVDLTAVQWDPVLRLGDERAAALGGDAREAVVRAYRQLAAQLRAQGMSEMADRFAYRAQIRQRAVLLRRFRLGPYLFSWFLAVLAGYGYRPGRTIFWYLAVVFGFAFAYMHFGHINGRPFDPDEALVFSVASFHGRGFFPGMPSLKDLAIKLAAAEAVIGLLIEVSFIATFTQRFFGAK